MENNLNRTFNEIGRLFCVGLSPETEGEIEMKLLAAAIKNIGDLRKLIAHRSEKRKGG